MVFTNALLSILGKLLDGEKVKVEEIPWHAGAYEMLFSHGRNNHLLDLRAKYLVFPSETITDGTSHMRYKLYDSP